jgi:hypothetical protein
MAFDTETITTKAKTVETGDSMALAASSLSSDASEEEVRKAVGEIVSDMLDALPTIITWWISDTWAAKLVARILDAVGQTLLKWLR